MEVGRDGTTEYFEESHKNDGKQIPEKLKLRIVSTKS